MKIKHNYGKKGTFIVMIFLTLMTLGYGYEALNNKDLMITTDCDLPDTNIPLWDYNNQPLKQENSPEKIEDSGFRFDSFASGPMVKEFEKPTETERLYQACKARDLRLRLIYRYVFPILIFICLLDFIKSNRGLIRILKGNENNEN